MKKPSSSTILGILAILFFIAVDYFAIYDLFLKTNSSETMSLLFAGLVAVTLEAAPMFMAQYISRYMVFKFSPSESRKALVGLFISLVTTLAVFAVVIGSRYNQIAGNVEPEVDYSVFIETKEITFVHSERNGFEEYWRQDSEQNVYYGRYEGFYLDFILMISPALTSAIAFLISWAIFQSDFRAQQAEKTQGLLNALNLAKKSYNEQVSRLNQEKISLWDQLRLNGSKPPDDINSYASAVSHAIANLAFRQIMHTLKGYLPDLQHQVEARLMVSREAMAELTPTPESLRAITIDDLVEKHNEKNDDPRRAWRKTDETAELLTQELRARLDNRLPSVEGGDSQ